MMRSFTHRLCTFYVHKRIFPLLFLSLAAPVTWADTNNALARFFDATSYQANVSNPTAYQGQAANYYSGGSLFVRTKIVDAQLVSVTVPAISAGCSGIDMFMGGFSHIKSDQLVKLGKAIIHNAPPFVVNLALQTWAPQLKQNLDQLQATLDKYLNQSVNSCQAAQAAIGGLAAFAAPATKKHVCATLGTQNNAFSDWVEAQHQCGAGGQAAGQLASAKGDASLKDMTKTNHNVIWSAIMTNPFLASDTKLAEFMMSLSGTYVYDQNGKPHYYPSLLTDNNNLIQTLLEGGKGDIYQCKNTGKDACVTLTKKTALTISKTHGIERRIRAILEGLLRTINTDQALTSQQKGFLEFTQTPVLKFFIDATATQQTPDLGHYARMMSVELLNQYLTNMLAIARQSLQNTNNDLKDIERITHDIDNAKRFTDGLADKAIHALLNKNALIASEKETPKETRKAIQKQTPPTSTYGQ
ncbi:conjugal transfer protein TraH [Vibrio tapetis subsp. quintayensis]|uniref:conjugal transfer protein TraH n=1 Tax=Vibrio tapetis TaxID=52443 RepID=UPI0025B5E7F0|nr:conjugal transfer protein TraH [Vibrio tapetis]MDN3683151.1 conjugal transfer protein TraH [Vibrio tapetis subsp. quintayensis]